MLVWDYRSSVLPIFCGFLSLDFSLMRLDLEGFPKYPCGLSLSLVSSLASSFRLNHSSGCILGPWPRSRDLVETPSEWFLSLLIFRFLSGYPLEVRPSFCLCIYPTLMLIFLYVNNCWISREKIFLRNPINKGLFRVRKKTLENRKKFTEFRHKKRLRLFCLWIVSQCTHLGWVGMF